MIFKLTHNNTSLWFEAKRNPIIGQDSGVFVLKLTKKKNLQCLIDSSDADWLNCWDWGINRSKSGKIYAVRYFRKNSNRGLIYLHRAVLGFPQGEVDHINGNTLDNRRENLRVCTHQQNQCNRKIGKNNTSGFKGVYFNKNNNNYRSEICFKNKKYFLGYFKSALEASKAYNKKSIELHGNFSRLS